MMKRDFRFSAEGDLIAGSPKVNEFGELLYVDMSGVETTDDAEGILIRDIPTQVSYLSEKQVIINRLRTDNPDWLLHPEIGANLSDLVGMPNTRDTGLAAKALVERALTYDGFIKPVDLEVRPVPVTNQQILIHITVRRKAVTLKLPVLMDLEHGIISEYEVKAE